MAEIKVLPQAVADKIAAGEVAERPAAVVKELVENSIDAGADRITVEIKKGGISYISVEDNGKGIPFDQVEIAFVRHATSKLREIEDLFEIQSMGFRGEALASICAVADVEVVTRERGASEGAHLSVRKGFVSQKDGIACNVGTIMVVENLFSAVPARMKFLKKDSTEAGYVNDVLSRIALSKPQIAFRYICDGKEIFSTSGDGNLKNAILNIYGIDHAKGVLEVCHTEQGVTVSGVVGKADLARGNRTRQTLFVNGRYIKNHVMSKIVEEAYRNVLMTGKFPFFVLNVQLSPSLVDVNVHPAKTEIKFANEKEVYDIVYHAVKNAIYKRPEMPTAEETAPVTAEKPSFATAEGASSVTTAKGSISPGFGVGQTSKEKEAVDPRTVAEFMRRTVPSKSPSSFREPMHQNPFGATTKSTALKDTEPIGIAEIVEELKKPSAESVTVGGSLAEPPEKTEKTEPVDLGLDFGSGEIVRTREEQLVVVGQVFDTYVIAQKGDRMFLVDQHAAHERKRFEMLKKDYEERGVSGQLLLTPIVLDVDGGELELVRENSETLENLGFDMEEFGKNSVIIRQTPFVSDEEDIKALALEVLSVIAEGRPSGLLSFEERMLDTISCKYAIKANKKLSVPEMTVLLKDVEELESAGIFTCPHGRPIKIEFSKKEIEKMFKRIV